MTAIVYGVSRRQDRGFSKPPVPHVFLRRDFGVVGDFHAGEKVRHVYDRTKNPDQPNLRQVHLQAKEVLDWLKTKGYDIVPGQMGENITTQGVDLMALPLGARLHIGDAVIELTGERTPCSQHDNLQSGLLKVIGNGGDLQTGVMGIVVKSGLVRPGDEIIVMTYGLPNIPLPRL